MARHLIREGSADKPLCGYDGYDRIVLTTDPTYPDLCSKCSSKHFGKVVKEPGFGYRLGERKNLTVSGYRRSFKSIYEVFNANDHVVGFVTIKSGWGQAWAIRSWEPSAHGEPMVSMSADTVGGAFLSSKEHALSMVPRLVAEGKLPDYVQAMAIATARAEKQRADAEIVAAMRADSMQKRAARNALIAAGFSTLLERNSLTDEEREAITAAAADLGLREKVAS